MTVMNVKVARGGSVFSLMCVRKVHLRGERMPYPSSVQSKQTFRQAHLKDNSRIAQLCHCTPSPKALTSPVSNFDTDFLASTFTNYPESQEK